MPFTDHRFFSAGGLKPGRPPIVEFRNGGVAVEDPKDAAIFLSNGYLWPNSLYRKGRGQLTREMKGMPVSTIEIYRKKDEGKEPEWTVLFVFLGDTEELRRRRMIFYNAELYIPPAALKKSRAELQAMRAERIEKAKATAAKMEGGLIT